MAVGFSTSGIDVIPDKGFTRQTSARTRVTTFGNGYEQRITEGINPLQNIFTANFSLRTSAEMNTIKSFLETNKGVTSFTFTTPEGETPKVVCENYTITYAYDGFYTLSATFREVFES